jgi:hypothetical protein
MSKFHNRARAAILALGLTASPFLYQPQALAQTKEMGQESQGIGMMISNIAGSGLTYERVFRNGWGFHVSGIGWGQGSSFFYNFGGAITKNIVEREWGDVYGLVAVGYGLNLFSGFSGVPGNARVESNVAPGIGVRWGILTAELGYSFYLNSGGPGLTPAGGAGLMFHF